VKPVLPGAILEPLRDLLSKDPNIARAWWKDGRLLVGLDDVGGDVDLYRDYVQRLSASVLPLLSRYGASFACGPVDGVAPSARGGTVIYERATT